jgi:hypothetical protein
LEKWLTTPAGTKYSTGTVQDVFDELDETKERLAHVLNHECPGVAT